MVSFNLKDVSQGGSISVFALFLADQKKESLG